jgi:hypothetical protein
MMDQEEVKNDRAIQEMIILLKNQGMIPAGKKRRLFYGDNLDRILNTISFSDSSIIPGIQLADVCCRTVWQCYEKDKCNRNNQLKPYFNRDENGILDPYITPK